MRKKVGLVSNLKSIAVIKPNRFEHPDRIVTNSVTIIKR